MNAAFRYLSPRCLCIFPVCASAATTASMTDRTMAEGVECGEAAAAKAAVRAETPAGVVWCPRMVLGEDES